MTPSERTRAIRDEFAHLVIAEEKNPYRDCIQGLANEPICVLALLKEAAELLAADRQERTLSLVTLDEIVLRLVENRPRVAIIAGSMDHPAHLLDREHALRAAVRIWENGGVPFLFGIPVICDGTAQNNIGQSYSLASRNQTAAMVNVNFEGHSYHAAWVISGCDKTPSGILSGLAAADVARKAEGRGAAPVWALMAPSHVLRGGSIPREASSRLAALADKAIREGHAELGRDIKENMRYILQCSSDEAFFGHLRRAVAFGLTTEAEARDLSNRLACATCHEKGGVCAFNGTGNSSRTLVCALGFTPRELELLTDAPAQEVIDGAMDGFFRCFNKPEYRVTEVLGRNFANAVRIHNTTGSSTNILLHLPAVMRHAGYDATIFDYERIQKETPVPELFAHSLTEGRDTWELALQFHKGAHRGMESLFKALGALQVPMDLDAPTMAGMTWGQRMADMEAPVSEDLGEKAIIRETPVRDMSGTLVLRGNFMSSAVVKVAGLTDDQRARFNKKYFVVRFYENEHLCNADIANPDLPALLDAMPVMTDAFVRRLADANGTPSPGGALESGLFFALVIAGQGPKAYGMPEMFAPSQNMRHHATLERSAILITDGRYSGVTKGPCIGHVSPEAFDGGGIGALQDGDILCLDLDTGRLDLMDGEAFIKGEAVREDREIAALREDMVTARRQRMETRQLEIAATSLMERTSTAEKGVVPEAVDRRATRRLPGQG
ncbi:dihydroxy-acid dehydratase domain-containing protein [Desulfoluna spongiiphila]|uniref:Dihydroxyacid dehydratase/phosphogluconate dehydratase n=1 Tax=Desulfoluna spongiiphila TaxID=419481 RepID=A0A1G5I8Z9_9BACT|nr:dihydroxy-acid dehydratase [Desulfoluna spongiiphila]SCY72626.1 Dihydroxyacid dehydratase/phosphogluconate dehydratase [Desulfoluna spongiiphila]